MQATMWPAGLSAGLQTSHTCVLGAAVRGHPRFCLTPRRNFCTPRCGGAVQSCPEQCRGHSWQRRKRWAQRCHSTTLPLDEDLPPRHPSNTAVPDCPPSTSGSDHEGPEDYVQELAQQYGLSRKTVMVMLASPLVAQFQRKSEVGERPKAQWEVWLDSAKETFDKKKTGFTDHAQYTNLIPPVSVEVLSYGRFMQLLKARQIKRVQVLGDGTAAIVDVAMEGWSMDPTAGIFLDRHDNSIMYGKENPEWGMEKIRYYVELPGDAWQDGSLMNLVKQNMVARPDATGHVPYTELMKHNETRPELVVLDPNQAWTLVDQNWWFLLTGAALIGSMVLYNAFQWVKAHFPGRQPDSNQKLIEKFGSHKAVLFNIGQGKRDTGVRYEDVAGLDDIKADIEDVMRMVLGDDSFIAIGAKPPRGILLEGPPGTGKTYLAKAMAGNSKLPFYSAVGSEFVEMFQGVAATRIRNLFKAARATAPSIVFIDELDALGKARSAENDGGSQEREKGLLQLMFEMDSMKIDDRVLVIAATNRKNMLDEALLRPGRFDLKIYMGRPTAANRLKILQVHAANRPIPRGGGQGQGADALLHQVAERTIGYSGADLANLLNEASILSVRYQKPQIDLALIQEAMDKRTLGLSMGLLAPSEAKARLARVQAGRAVGFALTPGVPPLEVLSIAPRGAVLTRLAFAPQEVGARTDSKVQLYSNVGSNAVQRSEPLSEYSRLCALLVPLCMPRAVEEVFFGPAQVSLATAPQMSQAGELAHFIVAKTTLHPGFQEATRSQEVHHAGRAFQTRTRSQGRLEHLARHLQHSAYLKALAFARHYRGAIEQIAEEMGANQDTISGSRIVDILRAQLPMRPDAAGASDFHFSVPREGPASSGAAAFGQRAGRAGAAVFGAPQGALQGSWGDVHIQDSAMAETAAVLLGRADLQDLTGSGYPSRLADEVRQHVRVQEARERLQAMKQYSTSIPAAFPPSIALPLNGSGNGFSQPSSGNGVSNGAARRAERVPA